MLKQRLKTAIKQLDEKNVQASLAAIYELEEIIQEYPQYHWQVMETLASFLRKNTAMNSHCEEVANNEPTNIRMDIQAALSVIGRRNIQQDEGWYVLDLSFLDTRGANLDGADFRGINFYRTNFAGASLRGANLYQAILSAANLTGATLEQANLCEAILGAANLSSANLKDANLSRANLYLANLHGAILDGADLGDTNLRDVNCCNTTFNKSNLKLI